MSRFRPSSRVGSRPVAVLVAIAIAICGLVAGGGTAGAEQQRPPGQERFRVAVSLLSIHVDSDGDGGAKWNCGEIVDSGFRVLDYQRGELASATIDNNGKIIGDKQKYCSGDTYNIEKLKNQYNNRATVISPRGNTLELRARYSEIEPLPGMGITIHYGEQTQPDENETWATGLATVKVPKPCRATKVRMVVEGYGNAGHTRMVYTYRVQTLT